MSRTYRRRGERHEYRWVLRTWTFEGGRFLPISIDASSLESRRAIARFHSDAQFTTKGGVPRWFCRIYKRSQRHANTQELLRWLADAGHDPVIVVRHRNSAKWAWW